MIFHKYYHQILKWQAQLQQNKLHLSETEEPLIVITIFPPSRGTVETCGGFGCGLQQLCSMHHIKYISGSCMVILAPFMFYTMPPVFLFNLNRLSIIHQCL